MHPDLHRGPTLSAIVQLRSIAAGDNNHHGPASEIMRPMADANDLRLLDEFLVGNAELEQVEAKLAAFNLFRVLRVEEMEIRHSNVLAWLLDPSETHGLGALFLRRFLSTVLLEASVGSSSLTPARVELMPFGEVEVYRERHNVDVLVRCAGGRAASAVRWCLLIENKIHAKESKHQLARYREAVQGEFPDDEIVAVFLTLDGDDPSDDGEEAGFVPMSHRQVLDVASAVIEQHKARIPNDARVFLSHYLESLRRLTMEETDELVVLCKEIYRKHRRAIDLIVEHGVTSQRYETCAAQLAKLVPCEFEPEISRYRVWFVPVEMGAMMPDVDMAGWKFLPRSIPACIWLRYSASKLRAQLSLEIGPAADQSLRQRILKAAGSHGLPVKEKSFATARSTRVITESMVLKEDPETEEADQSEDYIREVCHTLWAKFWPKAKAIVPALEEALRPEREAAAK